MSITITLTDAKFIDNGTKIGDQVLITNSPVAPFTGVDLTTFTGKFLVTSLVDNDTLIFDAFDNGTALNITDKGTVTVTYQIVHNLSKDEQIDTILAYAAGLKHKRVTLIWPPEAEMEDGTIVDGTFIAACLASAKSANPAQQGFTNFPIPGPYKLHYSNTYYTKAQLKRLVNGGVMVFVQDAPGANIYALRQVTTDNSLFANFELSCVNATDKVSADLVAMFKPYVGPYNISQDYLSLLNSMGDSYFYKAKNEKSPKCGALILDGKIDLIRANMNGENTDIEAGAIEVTASIEIGKPANWIQIKLLVY